MIINIRGTSGSGKSTLVRKLMSWYQHKVPVHIKGRKQPIYYKLWLVKPEDARGPDLIVLGHYEATCGGCDTISSTDLMFDLVVEAQLMATNVVFEGLLISADVNRVAELHQMYGAEGLEIMAIDLPLEDCLASVNGRRWAKDPTKDPVNPKNTESKWKGVQQSMVRLAALGVNAHFRTREGCESRLQEILLDSVQL